MVGTGRTWGASWGENVGRGIEEEEGAWPCPVSATGSPMTVSFLDEACGGVIRMAMNPDEGQSLGYEMQNLVPYDSASSWA